MSKKYRLKENIFEAVQPFDNSVDGIWMIELGGDAVYFYPKTFTDLFEPSPEQPENVRDVVYKILRKESPTSTDEHCIRLADRIAAKLAEIK